MKVTNIRTFLVCPGTGKNWLFVKVETDEGIHGWGECYTQADRDQAIEIHVHQLGRYLAGRSPFNIKHFIFMAYHVLLANVVPWIFIVLLVGENKHSGILWVNH